MKKFGTRSSRLLLWSACCDESLSLVRESTLVWYRQRVGDDEAERDPHRLYLAVLPILRPWLGPALLRSDGKGRGPTLEVQAVCEGGASKFDTESGSAIGLEYQVGATRGAKDTKGSGKLAVRLNFSDAQGKPHSYVPTGLKGKKDKHNGRYGWWCDQEGDPFALPRVQVEWPPNCAGDRLSIRGRREISPSDFDARRVLWPASHQEGYLPEIWKLEGCRGGIRTLGFDKDTYILKLEPQASVPPPPPIQEPTPVDPPPHPIRRPIDSGEKIEFRVPHALPPFQIGEQDECKLSRQPVDQRLDGVEVDCRRLLNTLELRFPSGEFDAIPGADLREVLRPRQLLPTSGKRLEGKPPSELWYCYGQCDQSANWARASRRGEYFSAPAVDDWTTPVEIRLVWRLRGIRYFVPSSLFELSQEKDLAYKYISPWGGRFRFPAPKVRFEASGGVGLSSPCRLHRGARDWTLDCDEAPAGQTLELRGYR